MNKSTASTVSRKLNPEERTFQKETLAKYRKQEIIPSLETIRRKTAAGLNTCVAFMHGNTTNPVVRAYIKLVLEKNLRPVPDDVKQLFALWDSLDSV